MASPRIIGYTHLESEDKKTLVQIFTDLDTDLIIRCQVSRRPGANLKWGSTTEVEKVA